MQIGLRSPDSIALWNFQRLLLMSEEIRLFGLPPCLPPRLFALPPGLFLLPSRLPPCLFALPPSPFLLPSRLPLCLFGGSLLNAFLPFLSVLLSLPTTFPFSWALLLLTLDFWICGALHTTGQAAAGLSPRAWGKTRLPPDSAARQAIMPRSKTLCSLPRGRCSGFTGHPRRPLEPPLRFLLLRLAFSSFVLQPPSQQDGFLQHDG